MKILLVANYENDGQRSMQRFATMLETELRKGGVDVEVIRPRAFFGRIVRGATGVGKWLGYIDKFFVFPFELMRKIGGAGPECVVHICDHSNAFYTRWLRGVPHLVTCSDVLAIRSARGEFPRHRTGFTGRQLQRMILAGLRRARRITCISEATRKDLLRLLGQERGGVDVTYMGVDASWAPMPAGEAAARLRVFPDVKQPYIQHVGGDQWYKNRECVVDIHEALGGRSAGLRLVMAGPKMDYGALAEVVWISGADDETLRALYSAAEILLFPSCEEGFGWPIVEAQACGCRVVTTGKGPMTEAGGEAAFYVGETAPGDFKSIEEACGAVQNVLRQRDDERASSIAAGIKNAARFSAERMAQRYVAIYKELLYKA